MTEMQKKNIAIVWFRNDLRLADHAALFAASQHSSIIPLYIWDPDTESPWQAGSASQWWLHHSLNNLDQALVEKKSKLIIMRGDRLKIFEQILEKFKIDAVYWNRSYEPSVRSSDKKIQKYLFEKGVAVQICRGNLIFEPGEIVKSDGTPYQVYSAFWRTFISHWQSSSSKQVIAIPPLAAQAKALSVTCDALNLLPTIPWDSAFCKYWQPSEAEADRRLNQFLLQSIAKYQKQRDLPGILGTSTLSSYLHFGQIHPQTIYKKIAEKFGDLKKITDLNIVQFCKELAWREFSHHLLYYFPTLPEHPMKKTFNHFPWRKADRTFDAWKKGLTGYPIVDAGMRQLWQTGWMHNRVRMIVASFLTKDLHISWQEGARWFWDTLLDADLANNTQGWQWTAGCGFDAAPFFRIFNPTSQGEKFDPSGIYIKTWCPELERLPQKWIHQPWMAPENVLLEAKVNLGVNYPFPIVDHKKSRDFSLKAYKNLKSIVS